MVSAFYIVSSRYSCNNVSIADASLDASMDITIKKEGSNVVGTTVVAIEGQRLAQSIDCALSSSNLSAYLTWKHQTNIVQNFSSGQQPGIYQVNGKNLQRLYINKPADSDSGVYSCEFSIECTTLLSKSFTLNGMYTTVLSVQLHVHDLPYRE